MAAGPLREFVSVRGGGRPARWHRRSLGKDPGVVSLPPAACGGANGSGPWKDRPISAVLIGSPRSGRLLSGLRGRRLRVRGVSVLGILIRACPSPSHAGASATRSSRPIRPASIAPYSRKAGAHTAERVEDLVALARFAEELREAGAVADARRDRFAGLIRALADGGVRSHLDRRRGRHDPRIGAADARRRHRLPAPAQQSDACCRALGPLSPACAGRRAGCLDLGSRAPSRGGSLPVDDDVGHRSVGEVPGGGG